MTSSNPGIGKCILIEEDFLMLFPSLDHVSEPPNTMRIRHGPLQKPAISPKDIVHPILRCAIELCQRIRNEI